MRKVTNQDCPLINVVCDAASWGDILGMIREQQRFSSPENYDQRLMSEPTHHGISWTCKAFTIGATFDRHGTWVTTKSGDKVYTVVGIMYQPSKDAQPAMIAVSFFGVLITVLIRKGGGK